MSEKPWIKSTAIALCFLLLGGAVLAIPMVREQVFILAGVFLVVALGATISKLRRRDPYDLTELARLHEREAIREIDLPGVKEGSFIVCPHCGTTYDAVYPICTGCRRSPNA